MTTVHSLEQQIRRMTPVAAAPGEQLEVAKFSQFIGALAHGRSRKRRPCSLVGPKGEQLVVPEAVFYVLERVAEVLARGDDNAWVRSWPEHAAVDGVAVARLLRALCAWREALDLAIPQAGKEVERARLEFEFHEKLQRASDLLATTQARGAFNPDTERNAYQKHLSRLENDPA